LMKSGRRWADNNNHLISFPDAGGLSGD